MSYQVLARKWRPQDFAALVGQAPIVTALRNALAEDRIAQAYIFSGIRGVGKTTTARVLAKALNCETRRANHDTDPCNACPSCQQITAGSDLDVIEVDAATYSKVEQVRELTESLRYAPASDRYKVVVLDEVHRLSRQAFDALLKIVEEPPAHLVFIFATTELDAVPATLLSRCQQFQFRRVPSRQLGEYLRTLADHESITATDTTLRLIARAGEGSVRDAVALLDQLATFGSGTVRDEDAARLVGGLDHSLLHRLLTAVVEGKPQDIRASIAEIDAVGLDPSGVYGHFVGYVRDALHLALGGDDESVDLVSDESAALRSLAQTAGYENLLRLLNLLLASEETIRRSELGGLALEITFLRAAELPKLTAIEALLRGGATGTSPSRPAATASAAARSHDTRTRGADPVADILNLVATRRPPLAGNLRHARALNLEPAGLVVVVEPGDTMLENALAREANTTVLEEAVREILGTSSLWRLDRGAVATEEDTPRETSARNDASSDHPTVQTVLEIFSGSKVERREPTNS